MKPTPENPPRMGQEAMYRGAWAYVVSYWPEGCTVILSGWHGLKTTAANLEDITDVRDRVDRNDKYRRY